MRVNARFEGVAEQQVEYLVKTTGRKVSDVLRESVAAYYQQMRGSETPKLRHLGPLIGTGDSGRTDLSVRYKEFLTDSWSDKYGLSHSADTGTTTAADATPIPSATDNVAPINLGRQP